MVSTLFGQDVNNNKEEQSENQYKTSSNFYINSDGLVVYKRSGSVTQSADSVHQTTTIDYNAVTGDNETQPQSSPVIVKKRAYTENESLSQNEEVEPVLIKPITKTPVNNYSAEESSEENTSYATVKKTSVGAVKKEALTVDESISLNSRSGDVNSLDDESVNTEVVNHSMQERKDSKQSAVSTEDAKKKYKKYNSYEKRPSQYKSIEEAALAVDAMIEELKKGQGKSTGAKSMSSRLSTGANRASLRKKPLSNASFSSNYGTESKRNKPSVSNSTESNGDWGDEPTYYINGTEVEQRDVDLLKQKDIIRKEFKIRNTISGNPNGEVWYEVLDYKKQ